MTDKTDRRCFLARGIAAAAGMGAAYSSIEEDTLRAAMQAQPGSDSSQQPPSDVPSGSLPCAKIGNVSLSRLVMGGNLIGGFAHSRDLMYVSSLFKQYNTEAKIFETLELAQACGIDTIQVSPAAHDPVFKYNQNRATKLQIMSNGVGPLSADKDTMNDTIKGLVDRGVAMLFTHGGVTDKHMMDGGSVDAIAQAVELIKAQGVPAGVGSHSLQVPMACEKNGVNPDFYVKTFHPDRYWSATPEEGREEYDWMQRHPQDHGANNDNMWCNNPEETAAFMEEVDKPWVAFKVMAAGAIHPRFAFSYAYKNGADVIVAGMFDFQVAADTQLARDLLRKIKTRKRPWRA